MNTVYLYKNALDHSEYELYENVNDVCLLLTQQIGTWPKTARIYHNVVAKINDVTPTDDPTTERLQQLRGTFHVVIYPEGIELIIAIVAIAIAALAIGLQFLFRAKQGQNESSPNNELGNRENKARPLERIPWIAGTVRSTPDLLVLPYKFFYRNQEFEYVYASIGVGHYDIHDCKDGTTPVEEIQGEFAAVFAPGSSPNSGTSQVTFGAAPPAGLVPPLVSISQNGAVNGQVVRAPNSGSFETNNNIAFGYGGLILTNDSNLDFTQYFTASVPGQPTYLTIHTNDDGLNADDPLGAHSSVGLAGTYQIAAVSSGQITLSNAATVNANWNALASYGGQTSTYYHTFLMESVGDKWVGPFILSNPNMTGVWANFVAENGLYYVDNKGRQGALHVTVLLEVTAVDATYAPVGDSITATGTIDGSALVKNICGVTVKCGLPSSGAVQVRAKLLTPMQTDTRNQYSQEIQWRELFAVSPVTESDFGDVTTVLAVTAQTQDALAVKQRKLNLLVTRKLPTWINRSAVGNPQMSEALYATNNAADIIVAMAMDNTIGRRTGAEIDIPGIYAICDSAHLNDPASIVNSNEHVDGEIATYFGTFLMAEFCYTFDDSKVSFEESLADIARAINCTAYRKGSTIGLIFEKQTADSTLLFNHRNKIPKTEARSVSFGPMNDNDGIEYTYIDPNAPNYPGVDTPVTLFFPADQSAANPKKIESVGVRNPTQALINGWRMYQKLMNANTQTEFTATQEATELVESSRILVADNTRSDTQDGEVTDQQGLTVSTSQPVNLVSGHTYTAFLQLYDGTVQSITATPGGNTKSFVLATAPNLPLVTDPTRWAKTTYWLVDNAATSTTKRPTAFLLTKKDPENNGTFKITAINYSDAYYLHDQDVLNGIITPPASGYDTAGYIGAGLLTATGSAYTPPARPPFSSSTYTGSTLFGTNNPDTQYTTAPPVYVDGAPLTVNGTALSNYTDLNNTTPAAPTGAVLVKFQVSGTSDKQKVSAYVPAPTYNGGLLTSGSYTGGNTTYTLPNTPAQPNELKVYDNGQRLYPTLHFTVSGATLSILGIDTTGDKVYVDSFAF